MTDLAELLRRMERNEVSEDELREALVERDAVLTKETAERNKYRQLYLEMLERCRRLERGILGQKSERTPAAESQLLLAMMGLTMGTEVSPEASTDDSADKERTQKETRKHPGRKPLPENLPRVEIEVLPREVEEEGLNAFDRIGEEVTETLEHRSSSSVVVRVVRPKFVRKDRDKQDTKVLVGELPGLPIERGLAGPGLLADSIVKRWEDHLPLNRLERTYGRDGIELARSTVCGWHMTLASLCKPLIDAMRDDALELPYLCTDATGVLVQAKEKCRVGHFWVLVAPERHVLFEFTKKHNGAAVDQVLAGYEGYLVADAHAVYDHLYRDGSVTEVNCWAHARRYFFKAMTSEPERARFALSQINALFRIERSIAGSPRKKREAIRKKRSKPVVERFFSWCQAELEQVLDETPIAKGIRYSLNQREGLERFLGDGRLPIHNNMSELQLRRQAVGRKNWLFVGSEDGAKANTTFVSLLASCRMHKIEPRAYLRDLLCLLPDWPIHRVLELSPLHWRTTSERADVVEALAANPYRAASLEND